MTKIIITTYDENTDERKTRLVKFLERLSADTRSKICRLHDDSFGLNVDWITRPDSEAFDDVTEAWRKEAECDFVSNFLSGKLILIDDHLDDYFPADVGGYVASMLTYSEHPESEVGFTEFVRGQAQARANGLAAKHADLTWKIAKQIGPKTRIGMLKSA